MLFVYDDVLLFKQKTAYGVRIGDWSSDVCSSDLPELDGPKPRRTHPLAVPIYLVSPLLDRGHVNLHRYHAKLHDTSFDCSPASSFTPICLWRPAGAPPSLWMAQKPPPSASLRPTGRKSPPTPPDSP